jgi:hypothetical protein
MIKLSAILIPSIGAVAILGATTALAGEITGPPPTVNDPAPGTSISSGNSRCSFSGLNDTPLGYAPQGDPGGIVQSYGYFMAQFGIFDPSDPDERAGFAFPGEGCNPTRTGGRH